MGSFVKNVCNDGQACQGRDAIISTTNDYQTSYLRIRFVKKAFLMHRHVCFKKKHACPADHVSFFRGAFGKMQVIIKVSARPANVFQLG